MYIQLYIPKHCALNTTQKQHQPTLANTHDVYQRNRSIVHEGERDTLSEAVVSLRTVVTFVTWLISRTEFSSSELVLNRHFS